MKNHAKSNSSYPTFFEDNSQKEDDTKYYSYYNFQECVLASILLIKKQK
jgi:hypothetical protein